MLNFSCYLYCVFNLLLSDLNKKVTALENICYEIPEAINIFAQGI